MGFIVGPHRLAKAETINQRPQTTTKNMKGLPVTGLVLALLLAVVAYFVTASVGRAIQGLGFVQSPSLNLALIALNPATLPVIALALCALFLLGMFLDARAGTFVTYLGFGLLVLTVIFYVCAFVPLLLAMKQQG